MNSESGNRNIYMGNGDYRENNIKDQGIFIENQYHTANQKTLSEAAAEIQQLLEQLDKTYSTDTTTGQMTVATEVIKALENNPSLADRILSALRVGGVQALQQTLNHPAATFILAALEEWRQSKSNQ